MPLGDAEIVILGMGRVGTCTFDVMSQIYGNRVLGVEYNNEVAHEHNIPNRNVLLGDVTDYDFWSCVKPASWTSLAIFSNLKTFNTFAGA